MAQSTSFGLDALWPMHEVCISCFCYIFLLTLKDPCQISTPGRSKHHDCCFHHERYRLHCPEHLPGRFGCLQHNPVNSPFHHRYIATADGISHRSAIYIEMQIIKADGTAMTEWFQEQAVLSSPVGVRLSGNAMRNHLYFATAPGNTTLYVAVKKNGITSQLPVV